MCMIGEIVVVGGVRRSALISLSNLTDRRMREAKVGAWWELFGHRKLANNSVCYTEKPDAITFQEEWLSLAKSRSGERGIYNRVAAQKQAAKFGRDGTLAYGCNPCSEIILRDKQFCNLTEVVVRAEDTFTTLSEKIRLASILGTIQSTLTKFQFLGDEWKRNTEEERLLGVSLTGIMDNNILNGNGKGDVDLPKFLEELRDVARKTNTEWADRLDVGVSMAITCVKPSGTVSQLVDSGSGIHPRHSAYYVRTIRQDNNDPFTKFLIDQGIPHEPDVTAPNHTTIFSFPQASPKGSVTRNDRNAIEQLELWLIYQRHWCEHKPSITVYYKEDEIMEVGAWVFKHFDEVSGISFLPYDGGNYRQAPYQDITEEEYIKLDAAMPKDIDWTLFKEEEDNTIGTQTLACVGPSCEL